MRIHFQNQKRKILKCKSNTRTFCTLRLKPEIATLDSSNEGRIFIFSL